MDTRVINTQVLVIGAGNAGMSAAVAAREQGAKVIVLEKAPREQRGGNSAIAVHMRFPYRGMEDLAPLLSNIKKDELRSMSEKVGIYSESDYYSDIMSVTNGQSDCKLANTLVSQSYPTIKWMRSYGHLWTPTYKDPSSANVVSFLGGGYNLQQKWFRTAERTGITVHYGTRVTVLKQNGAGNVTGVLAKSPGEEIQYNCGAIIIACGSFEANPEMRVRHLGPGWESVKIRGVPFNTGDGLNMAIEIGAQPHGSWSTCHASPQDANRPVHEIPGPGVTGEYWSRYAYPFGVMVNIDGRRFVDEGETWRGLTYAKTGSAILSQPEGIAFQIFDAGQRRQDLIRGYENATGSRSSTLERLGTTLGIKDVKSFVTTIQEFNGAIKKRGFDPFRLDGKGTTGISLPKTNWATPIINPPFEGFPVVCGMTFTYGGLHITSSAQVLHQKGQIIPGLYAAGEIVGGLWHENYPSGGGMMAGAVFGRIAGTQAGRCVNI